MRNRPVIDRRGRWGQKLGGTPPPSFSPADVAGLSWWLDERDQVVVPGPPDKVSDWGDQSTGGLNDFTQASVADRPVTGTVNGIAAPECVSADYLYCSRTLSQILSLTAFTVYIVSQPTTINTLSSTLGYNCNTLWGQAASGFYGCGLQIDGAGTGYRGVFSINDGSYKTVRSADGSVSIGQPTLVVVRMQQGSAVSIRVNGTALVSTAFGTFAAAGNSQSQRIGQAYSVAFGSFFGNLASYVGYSSLIADGSGDDTNIRSYLATTYGGTW